MIGSTQTDTYKFRVKKDPSQLDQLIVCREMLTQISVYQSRDMVGSKQISAHYFKCIGGPKKIEIH